MTQIEAARKGIITDEMRYVAGVESVDVNCLLEDISRGKVVILKNLVHKIKPSTTKPNPPINQNQSDEKS